MGPGGADVVDSCPHYPTVEYLQGVPSTDQMLYQRRVPPNVRPSSPPEDPEQGHALPSPIDQPGLDVRGEPGVPLSPPSLTSLWPTICCLVTLRR
uniref:Uncharacterized protein n=1 Tax=Knipowitschia caucasica TaxID=637954 RepID=A0AAV2JPZ1_KNICA